jgi:alkanesulfonate monooxygenase SsuD/methylene tetrahydromethanopterin reductase-like flavin-dependent oxidoreductase (luciferase family)
MGIGVRRLSALYVHGGAPAMLELAPELDALGYHRFWVAENQPQMSAVLATALVAGKTDRMRVGTAAVLAHFHAPLALAQDFEFLDVCYPGRIDLGFCGSWISEPRVLAAMLDNRDPVRQREAYPIRIASLVDEIRRGPAGLPLWSMGTDGCSVALAANHGLGFAYSVSHNDSTDDPAIVMRYRDEFRGTAVQPDAAVVVATAGVCAETEAAAQALALAWSGPVHVPRIVGNPQSCREQLERLCERYDVDEIVFADLVVDHERRLSCYHLLAEACGL